MIDRPLQHVAYIVDDIPAAVDAWVAAFGAGPFFWLGEHIEFDEALYRGEPCVFDHSAAIGAWGPVLVELTTMHRLEPPAFAAAFAGDASRGPRIAHASYIVDDAEAECARLEDLGMPQFLYARQGPIAIRFHECPLLGHPIEVHQHGELIDMIYGLVAGAAAGWDGSDPLRELPAGG